MAVGLWMKKDRFRKSPSLQSGNFFAPARKKSFNNVVDVMAEDNVAT